MDEREENLNEEEFDWTEDDMEEGYDEDIEFENDDIEFEEEDTEFEEDDDFDWSEYTEEDESEQEDSEFTGEDEPEDDEIGFGEDEELEVEESDFDEDDDFLNDDDFINEDDFVEDSMVPPEISGGTDTESSVENEVDAEDEKNPVENEVEDTENLESSSGVENGVSSEYENETENSIGSFENNSDELIEYENENLDFEINEDTDTEIDETENSDELVEVVYSGGEELVQNGSFVLQDTRSTDKSFRFEYIPVNKIAVTERIRKNKSVGSLLKSIQNTGLLNPIVVAPLETEGLYVLISGYKRLIACAKAGIKEIPAIVNEKVDVKNVQVLEAMYNHSTKYSIKEQWDFICKVDKDNWTNNPSLVEYLLQMEPGDSTKLMDIMNDDDDDIVTPLLNGEMTIAQAFKKLEARRKKESKEGKEEKRAENVYNNAEESGIDSIDASGEEGNEEFKLSDSEIEEMTLSNEELAEVGNSEESLDNMVAEGDKIDGFEDHKQDYKHREILDPALRKSVMARDNNTCQCCGLSGQEYVEVLDAHHKIEVYLGGSDNIDNLIALCTVCHKMVHLYGRGELHIRPENELSADEVVKFKKIIKLGSLIREGMKKKNMSKDSLKKVDNAETIGRTKPGTGQIAG